MWALDSLGGTREAIEDVVMAVSDICIATRPSPKFHMVHQIFPIGQKAGTNGCVTLGKWVDVYTNCLAIAGSR